MVGMLSTLLCDAGYGLESGNMEDGAFPGRDGQFCAALRVDAFRPLDEVRARVDKVGREIAGSRRRPGVERLHPPGRLEAELEKRYAVEGIPLDAGTLAGIAAAAKGLGVEAGLA